ncbi:MAG: hypothetical protein ACSLEL_04340 [Candidatus Malihini olakiniferum]
MYHRRNKRSGLLSVPGRIPEHRDSIMSRIQRFSSEKPIHYLNMITICVIAVVFVKWLNGA